MWNENEKELTIIVTEDWLRGTGTCSLTGRIVNAIPSNLSLDKVKSVVLNFPKSSRHYCEKNNGPRDFVVREYNIPCLLEDVLNLTRMGIEIKFTEYTVE